MKNITMSLLLLVSVLQAQPILTASDFDANVYYKIHNGSSITPVGGDMIFSSIESSSYGSYRSIPLSTIPNASNFPSATSAIQYTYDGVAWQVFDLYETSATYHKKIAHLNGDFINTNNTLITELPLNYHEYTSELGGFYYDSFGTVTTPYGTYNDVILLKKTWGSLQSLFNYEYRWIATNPYKVIAINIYSNGISNTVVYEYLDYTLNNNSFRTNSFAIYPNPTQNDFILHNTNNFNTDVFVSVYDILGKELVSSIKANGNFNNISLKDFSPGLYIVKITNEENQVLYTEKIIKK